MNRLPAFDQDTANTIRLAGTALTHPDPELDQRVIDWIRQHRPRKGCRNLITLKQAVGARLHRDIDWSLDRLFVRRLIDNRGRPLCPTCGNLTGGSEAWSTAQCDDCWIAEHSE